MSLQVWLPLTKDLRQQGLSNVTVTNNGATYSSADGKLGGCYSFDGTDDRIAIVGLSLPNTWSYGCWFYSATSTRGWEGVITLNSSSGDADNQLGFYTYPTSSRIQNTANGQWNSAITYTTGQWNHFFGTFDGSNLKTYINGILVDTKAITNSLLSRSNLTIGGRSSSAAGGNTSITLPFQGKINDVRIYDHCLSPMEVKQLAQGLVLHYPLNNNGWGNENLLTSSYRDITTWDRTAQGTWSITHNNESNTVILVSTASWEHLYKLLPITFETGVEYTLSCRYKVLQNYNRWNSSYSVGLSLNTYNPGGGNAQYPTDVIIPFGSIATGYVEDKITFTATASTYYLDINGGYIADGSTNIGFEIANIKLEKGSKMTPWCPNSSDVLATTMGLNSTIEYDCSGFCNNGARTGTFSWTSDTPKYTVSTKFNGAEVIVVPFTCGSISEAVTVACWGYESNWNVSTAERLLGAATNASGWCIGDYSSENTLFAFYANGGYNAVTGFKQLSAGWHHFVITFDGLNLIYYVDSQQFSKKTFSTKQVATGNYNINIGRHYGGGYNFKGNMSDVRIYATALSADDVKSLYQNSAYIDSSGNVYGAVHSEV